MKTTRLSVANFGACAMLACLFAGCRLVPYGTKIDGSALISARELAAEVSDASVRAYLEYFKSPRCMYLGETGVATCASAIVNALKADGYNDDSIAIDMVTIDGMTIADADTPGGGFSVAGPFSMPNIIVTKTGSDPGLRPILVGAHYDTVAKGPGVDDNGSGCAALLEIARVLAYTSLPRTIVMTFFAFEEPGLFGSARYVAGLADSELPIVAYILDTIGVTSAREKSLPLISLPAAGDFIAAMSASPEDSRAAVADFIAVNAAIDLGLPAVGINADANAGSSFITGNLLRSDHLPFCIRGIPAVLITDTASFRDRADFYHLSTDTVDNIDFAFFEKTIAATLANVVVKAYSE